MNNVSVIGRLTKDPVIKNEDDERRAVCRYTLAVGRPGKDGKPEADFFNIVCFGRAARTAAKFFKKGIKIGVTGQLHSGSYQNKEGRTVYYTEVIATLQEFCEKKQDDELLDMFNQLNEKEKAEVKKYVQLLLKKEQPKPAPKEEPAAASDSVPDDDSFMNIPDDYDDYLPFN